MSWKAAVAFAVILGAGSAVQRPVVLEAQSTQAAPNIEGSWQGTLHTGEDKDLLLVFKVTEDGGVVKAVLYSIDQKAPSLAADKATFVDGKLTLTYDVGLRYSGKLSADGNSIDGTFSQGKDLPMVLQRATPTTAWAIPETTAAPKIVPVDPKADLSFEVATIKPSSPDEKGMMFTVDPSGSFKGRNITLERVISIAYDMHKDQLVGLPGWASDDKFDIDGKPDTPGLPSLPQLKNEVRKLIAERFALKFHTEQRQLTAYQLAVDKNGLKMQPAASAPGLNGLPGFFFRGLGNLHVANATMADFAGFLQASVMDRPVVDHTGLGDKRWTFDLKWQIDNEQAMKFGLQKVPPPAEGAEEQPPLEEAMPKQLGLLINSGKTAVDVMVVDHVEKPSAN
ncbi:TIGR03435 family protein [Silvibacterium sp.]|uniref:TIGR03435 family protein n=1 Tax=Silvibacterium sp. TaxID=1964179 RepID=UPI0039E57DEB